MEGEFKMRTNKKIRNCIKNISSSGGKVKSRMAGTYDDEWIKMVGGSEERSDGEFSQWLEGQRRERELQAKGY